MTGAIEYVRPSATLGARLYAALHRGNDGDVDFYVRACRSRKRLNVIEFGSGALRIGLALARAGHHVTGIEVDAALHALAVERLEAAQREAKLGPVELVQEDMANFRSSKRFDKVLIPYSALWCLTTTEQKRRCLVTASNLLDAGGELILDVYPADHLRDESNPGGANDEREPQVDDFELTEHVATVGVNERYLVFERNTWWPWQKHTRVEYGLQRENSPNERWAMTLDHHYLWRHELAELLDESGFVTEWGADEKAYGTAFDGQIVVRGKRYGV
jgi:hypothetical protein